MEPMARCPRFKSDCSLRLSPLSPTSKYTQIVAFAEYGSARPKRSEGCTIYGDSSFMQPRPEKQARHVGHMRNIPYMTMPQSVDVPTMREPLKSFMKPFGAWQALKSVSCVGIHLTCFCTSLDGLRGCRLGTVLSRSRRRTLGEFLPPIPVSKLHRR